MPEPLEPGHLPEGQQPNLPGLFSAIDSARTIMALSSRDWSTANDAAWLWGIFLGWGPDDEDPDDTEGAWRELADRHGWDSATLDRLRTLHAAVGTLTINSIGDLMAQLDAAREVARVRADVAEGIAQDLAEWAARSRAQADAAGLPMFAFQQNSFGMAYDNAADVARRHTVAPAESVVGAPTDTQQRCRVVDPRYGQCELYDGHLSPDDDRHRTGSLRWPSPVGTLPEAVSDLAAPRDALTDQDFVDLRAAFASARLTEVEYGLRHDDREAVSQYGSREKAEYWASVSQPGWELVCRQVGPWRPVDTVARAGWAPCCDMHNTNCESPSELCCANCTEATHHGLFPHADGSACVLDAPPTAEVGALPVDEGTRP